MENPYNTAGRFGGGVANTNQEPLSILASSLVFWAIGSLAWLMRSLDFESEVFLDLQRAKACQFERWVHSKHWNIQVSLLKLVKPTDRTSVINSSYSRWLESYKGTARWITSRVSQTSCWKCVFDAHKLTWTAFRRGTDNFVSLSPFLISQRKTGAEWLSTVGFVIRMAFYIWHTFGKQLFE